VRDSSFARADEDFGKCLLVSLVVLVLEMLVDTHGHGDSNSSRVLALFPPGQESGGRAPGTNQQTRG
jgi:hypothetical protein